MTLKLYNTRTRVKEDFVPIDPANVRMYVCGPTVYDRAHIGNARPVVVFDVLTRLLRHVFGSKAVTYARNFTDVDDKINDRSAETGRPIRDITDETIGWYHEDMDALGAARPDAEPRCTEYIPEMIAMSETLIEKGFAYVAEGHVLFSVDSYDRYGQLSRRSLEDMIAGARVEVAPYKKNPMDFVIWKPSTPEQPGWESPWGRGRPGWHIECSAMADEILWKRPQARGDLSAAALALPHQFDIHGGGIDLQFPHHENELAQSTCAHGTERLANFWMHNEMIRVEGQKMSKSLGNFFTVRDLLNKGIPGEVIRMVMLSTHYRSPLDWTQKRVEEAKATLEKWRRLGAAEPAPGEVPDTVISALLDDLNTPKAISEMHALSNSGDVEGLRAAMALLNLRAPDLEIFDLAEAGEKEMIEELLDERDQAKKSKDFNRADEIRDGFAAAGVIVKDTPQGAVWELGPEFDPSKLRALR
ncbi:MAG: cysteine--tRNA ligase [Pseudomonadota bacterium]